VREGLEFVVAWLVLKTLGALPRPAARAAGAALARVIYWLHAPLRRTALVNLRIAFPEWTDAQRRRVLRGFVRQMGWQAAEFAHFPRYTPQNVDRVIQIDGLENFLAGHQGGKGVLYLTGHMGAWEMAPMRQALQGYPLHFLVRRIPNRRVEELINRYRSVHGNTPVDKKESARAIFKVLRRGGAVGILIDLNTLPEEGVFVDFFGVPACTTTGLARIALRTEAAVVPVYVFWEPALRKYHLRFEPPLDVVRTGDEEADVVTNTARFTKVIEGFARRFPDQWLWVHKRWKTRPPGASELY